MIRSALFTTALYLGFSFSALASWLDIGNVAPGAGAVAVRINNQEVASSLGYSQFHRIESTDSILEVQITRRSDGTELFRDRFHVRDIGFGSPLLALVGNGVEEPWTVLLHDDGFGFRTALQSRGIGIPSVDPWNYRIMALNVSPTFAREREAQVSLRCQTVAGGGYASHLISSVFGRFGTARSYPRLGSNPVNLGDPQFGNRRHQCHWRLLGSIPPIEMLGAVRQMFGSVTQVFAIGDGKAEPIALIEVVDGAVTARSSALPSAGNANPAKSRDIWFDQDRSAHSIAMFEIPATGLTLGTWQTFASDGRPTWYMIEATASSTLGRRDVLLRELQPGAAGGVRDVGLGVLRYLNCNSAELRVVLDGGGQRTLRLSRSLEVSSCGGILN